MKRFLNVLMAGVMLVLFSVSCSKTDADGLDDRLVGTKWQTSDSVAELFYGGTCYQVYEFVSTKEVERYTTKNGNVHSSDGVFSYTLNYPKITINVKDSDGTITPTDYTFKDSRTMERDGAVNSFYKTYIRQ